MDCSTAPLLENAHAFLVMRNLYAAAGRQLTLKIEVLNSEFIVLYARNPIHHIESRVKSPESIAAKLLKKGLPLTLESAMQNVNDIAGVRGVFSYIDDVYRVAEMGERQQDLEIVKRQDYIKTPNYTGYRSLHLDLRVPVYLSDRTEQVLAEVQIRTIAMDFWASLEHDIRYKADRSRLPAGINEEMLACASGRITLMIELKYTGQEDALEESELTLLQDYDMVDECIIGSMNKGILQKMKELVPGISTVFIAHDLEEEDYELDYADSYSIEGRNLTVDMVDAIHYCGKSVYGWTANTSGAMLRFVNCGADGVITDDVRLLQTFLREQACRKAFASVY